MWEVLERRSEVSRKGAVIAAVVDILPEDVSSSMLDAYGIDLRLGVQFSRLKASGPRQPNGIYG